MNSRGFLLAAGALVLALAAFAPAQGPLYDKVIVDMPYTVTVGEHTLQPGKYVIRQLDSPAGGSRVLLVYSDNGMKFETSALTIPALDNRTAADTKVILHHFGNDYYFDKIWVQGKDYGYEFPLPDSVKARERERMAPLTVAATYQAEPAAAPREVAQAPAPAPAPEPAPVAQPAPAPEPAPAAPEPAPVAQAPAPVVNEADRMPATSANWLMMLLGGGALAGAGLAVRRRA
jgi:hypothetical protein